MDRIAETVNHASYGYAGFFNVVKIEEAGLDRMIEFDSKMIDEAEKIVQDVAAFKAETARQDLRKAKDRVRNLSDVLEAFEQLTMVEKK
jgi:predicted translin family RNA/ssDNA-binding protein